MAPLPLAYARKCPSIPPEKTMPGIAVTAADCAGCIPVDRRSLGGAWSRRSDPTRVEREESTAEAFRAEACPGVAGGAAAVPAVSGIRIRQRHIHTPAVAAEPPARRPARALANTGLPEDLAAIGSTACTTPDF